MTRNISVARNRQAVFENKCYLTILPIIEGREGMALNLEGERLIRFQAPRLSKVDFCNHCLERKPGSFRMKWRGWIGRLSRIFQMRILNILRTKFQAETMKFYTHDVSMKILKLVISYRVIEYVIFSVLFRDWWRCICYIKMNN